MGSDFQGKCLSEAYLQTSMKVNNTSEKFIFGALIIQTFCSHLQNIHYFLFQMRSLLHSDVLDPWLWTGHIRLVVFVLYISLHANISICVLNEERFYGYLFEQVYISCLMLGERAKLKDLSVSWQDNLYICCLMFHSYTPRLKARATSLLKAMRFFSSRWFEGFLKYIFTCFGINPLIHIDDDLITWWKWISHMDIFIKSSRHQTY